MKNEKFVLGLDIGISSIGWALVDIDDEGKPTKIKDVGVRIFTPGENVKTGESKARDRRLKRGVRRVLRRRAFRVNCIRKLLAENSFLPKPKSTLQSEIFNELKNSYEKIVNDYYKNKDTNPFILKVEALDRKLTSEELSIILVHYAKHRGYISNRDENESDTGKVKSEILANETLMSEKKYRTVSEMLIKDDKFKNKIHNTTDDYKLSVTRSMIEEEINRVLDCQKKFGLITDNFKNDYIKIWSGQRHFSNGPGGNSKYGGDLIARMTGLCRFTYEPRAPKQAPSSEIFVALTKLVNMKVKINNEEEYRCLTKEEIYNILNSALKKKTFTYNDVKKCLSTEILIVNNLDLTTKEFTKVLKEFKNKILNRDDEERVDFSLISDENKAVFEEMKNKEKLNKKFIEFKTISDFKSKFNAFGSDEWNHLLNNIEVLDEIAVILTNNKTEESVTKAVKDSELIDNKYIETILSLPNLKDHMNLSLSLIRKLNKILINGITYDKAMEQLGYNHSDLLHEEDKKDLLVPVNINKDLRNQRVIRSLSQTRKVLNAIIKKYGMPYKINIETAGELAKDKKERDRIKKRNEDNKYNNEKLKKQILELKSNVIFKSESDISGFDLLKFKLWNEQQGLCAYSGKIISIDELFDNNIVQVDHILPYSRTYDDSYNNKTLVLTKENQDKKNRTPYEWLKNTEKWEKFKKYINSLETISEKKKNNYLLTDLTPDIENQMRNQNINDTKYITRYLTSFLKAYLNVPFVDSVNGVITAKLRARWGFNNITHSLQSPTYYIKDMDVNNDVNKNRENHLHHALDACIIACTNKSLIQNITNYEKYKNYIESQAFHNANNNIENEFITKIDDKYVDVETGEIIETSQFKEYYNELLEKNYIIKNNNKVRVMFPKPYDDFDIDVRARIFERNPEQLRFMLEGMKKYSEKELEEITPIIPSFAKNKVSGSLHEETLKGVKTINNIKYSTLRTSVLLLTDKNIEKIFDKENGNKVIYKTLKEWLNGSKKGEDAYKQKGYPKDSDGNIIKKVKLQEEFSNKGHKIGTSIVEKGNIYKILMFKDRSNGSLYFAGLDLFDILNIKRNMDYEITIWKSTSQKEIMKFSNAKMLYEFNENKDYLMKNDFVKIIKNDDNFSYCYITGFSQGKVEVSSYLGDSYDLVGDNKLFSIFYAGGQYPVTISTIKSIKKINLSVLGKITENKMG